MRSFAGEFKRTPKVSLAGKSRQAESREQVLERTQREREHRRQQKLENTSATTIQAAWRAHSAVQQARDEVRAAWMQRYGPRGQGAAPSDLAVDSPYLRELCFFANAAAPDDVALVVAACQLAVTPTSDAVSHLAAAAAAAGGAQAAAVLLLRAQRLVQLALDCLSAHSAHMHAALAAPRLSEAKSASLVEPASILVEGIIALTSVDTWQPAIEERSIAFNWVAKILRHLSSGGMFTSLARVVSASCHELHPMPHWVPPPTPAQKAASEAACIKWPAERAARETRSVPCAEALCTWLIEKYLWFRDNEALLAQRHPCSPAPTRRPPPTSTPAHLLCVPQLWQRCPSLVACGGHLWRHAVTALGQLSAPADLAASLPGDLLPLGKAGAAVTLLGNLVEHICFESKCVRLPGMLPAPSPAIALVRGPGDSPAAMRDLGLHYIRAADAIMSLLPARVFEVTFKASSSVAGDDDAELEWAPAPAGAHRLRWPEGEMPNGATRQQLDHLSSTSGLGPVVRAILPAVTAAQALSPDDAQEVEAAGRVVRELCIFSARVMKLPGHRGMALRGLNYARLVPRMWFSYLRAAYTASGPAWDSSQAVPGNHGVVSYAPKWMLQLTLFSEVYREGLMEPSFIARDPPLPVEELYSPSRPHGVLSMLKSALWKVLWTDATPVGLLAAHDLPARFARSAGLLLARMHDFNARARFAPPGAFYAEGIPPERFYAEISAGVAAGRDTEDPGHFRAWNILAHAPFLVPFHSRARVFYRLVSAERAKYQDRDASSALFGGGPRRFVSVRRGHVLQDAFAALYAAPLEELRGRLRVAFVSEHGLEEAGVDGGGLFKEFLEQVVKEGFDPSAKLFRATTDGRLYPSPAALSSIPGAAQMMEFLGRVVGKALWEGILLELPLAPFFLKKFRGGKCDLNDLPTLDPQLAENLAKLSSYEGTVEDLGLTFTIMDEVAGRQVEVPLGPEGILVNAHTVPLYTALVANFRLNVQPRTAVAAFLHGLRSLIPQEWVAMFNDVELQELIGGAEGGAGLNLADMRSHVKYSGGYSDDHPVIQAFWGAMERLTPVQHADFLRFVTSCPRPPLLGFAYLEPPLVIQMAGLEGQGAVERLPTAATCMNLLKLPPYQGGPEAVRRKLVYAIEAQAGFELS